MQEQTFTGDTKTVPPVAEGGEKQNTHPDNMSLNHIIRAASSDPTRANSSPAASTTMRQPSKGSGIWPSPSYLQCDPYRGRPTFMDDPTTKFVIKQKSHVSHDTRRLGFVEVNRDFSNLEIGLVRVPIRLTDLVQSIVLMESRFPCPVTRFVTHMVAESIHSSVIGNAWSPSFDGNLWYKKLLAEILKEAEFKRALKKIGNEEAMEMLDNHEALMAQEYGPHLTVSKITIPDEAHLLPLFLIRDVWRFDGSPFNLAYEHAIRNYLGYATSGRTCVAGRTIIAPTTPTMRVDGETDEYDNIAILPDKTSIKPRPHKCHYTVTMNSGEHAYALTPFSSKWFIKTDEVPPTDGSGLEVSTKLGGHMIGNGGVIRQDIVPVPSEWNDLIEWSLDVMQTKNASSRYFPIFRNIMADLFMAVQCNCYPSDFGGTKWYQEAAERMLQNSDFSSHGPSRREYKRRVLLLAEHINGKTFNTAYIALTKMFKMASREFDSHNKLSEGITNLEVIIGGETSAGNANEEDHHEFDGKRGI